MAYASSIQTKLQTIEEDTGGESVTPQRRPTEGKSKNLHAERRRRQKLSANLLALRSTVPIITDMKNATIISDAIMYIQQLQKTVNILKDQLEELEKSSAKVLCSIPNDNVANYTQLIKTYVQADVKISRIDEHKLWIRILFEKRKGAFTKLIQALNSLGFEVMDMSVTTVKGAVLVTSIINGMFCPSTAQQIEDSLLRILNGF